MLYKFLNVLDLVIRVTVNLLKETIEVLRKYGKTENDIRWVGSKDGEYAISWEEFKKIADVEYDNGYGAAKVALDLIVVGDNWWLERYEYDGAECWDYKEKPEMKNNAKKFSVVVGDLWPDLKKLNSEEE